MEQPTLTERGVIDDKEYEATVSPYEKVVIETIAEKPFSVLTVSVTIMLVMCYIGFPLSMPAEPGSKRACQE